jgi:putative proteasome-type protease
MHSGLRSLRDKTLLYFEEAFARESGARDRLYRAVNLYAQQVRRVAREDAEALERAELKFNLYTVIGGQMAGDSAHRLFLVYPEGNWVEIGPDTPYQIIGATGFGKPILERSLTRSDSMVYAFKVGLLRGENG